MAIVIVRFSTQLLEIYVYFAPIYAEQQNDIGPFEQLLVAIVTVLCVNNVMMIMYSVLQDAADV